MYSCLNYQSFKQYVFEPLLYLTLLYSTSVKYYDLVSVFLCHLPAMQITSPLLHVPSYHLWRVGLSCTFRVNLVKGTKFGNNTLDSKWAF